MQKEWQGFVTTQCRGSDAIFCRR